MSVQSSDNQHFLKRIHDNQQPCSAVILHYNPISRDLPAWFWPVTSDGRRVFPSNLLDYRNFYDFRTPCCLCAINGVSFTESAIYVAVRGPYSGEYVAGCASGVCGYLERLYAMRGLLLQKYSVHALEAHAPAPVVRQSRRNATPISFPVVPLAGPGVAASVPTYEAPIRGPETVLNRLLRLDSWARSGLSESEFNRLFAKCRCGLIMTRRVFRGHICAVAAGTMQKTPAVIDLTLDEGDNFVRERSSQLDIIDLTMDSDKELQ
ncbi:hypothetical protein PILCRDRAFT_15292 [Piloderma croceum F 1598]|uniref:Uncharacterized protein n=1 Tax=Piloderma croceum (strain F 1598) TaxID=765440 RepID=A0A0C3ELB2_PILCF|nr:hypothetical protein PILCRDRAFT_15292 [Piloderma croceum F 1598]